MQTRNQKLETGNWKLETVSLKPHKNWFRMQRDGPCLFYFPLDFVFERYDVRGGCAAAVHDCERVFAGDADGATAVSFVQSGLFDQPCCRNLEALSRDKSRNCKVA